MNRYQSEADARIEIDELLRQAGWDPADKSMVGTEVHLSEAVGVREPTASYDGSLAERDASEDDREATVGSIRGRADYVLYRPSRPPARGDRGKEKRHQPLRCEATGTALREGAPTRLSFF